VRKGGLEPEKAEKPYSDKSGQNQQTDGQKPSKPAQIKGETDVTHSDPMTPVGHLDDSFGHPQNKKRPQPAHNGNPVGNNHSAGFNNNLQSIIDAWPDLSDEIKIGIMAMVKATKK